MNLVSKTILATALFLTAPSYAHEAPSFQFSCPSPQQIYDGIGMGHYTVEATTLPADQPSKPIVFRGPAGTVDARKLKLTEIKAVNLMTMSIPPFYQASVACLYALPGTAPQKSPALVMRAHIPNAQCFEKGGFHCIDHERKTNQ